MTKKLTFLFALILSTLTASAYDAQINGIYYNLVSNTKVAEVTFGDTEYTGRVSIPSIVTYNDVTYNVTSIGNEAFMNSTDLTFVTIPSSVTSIGNNAFQSCSGLASVTIPNSVISIGNAAFNICPSLGSISVENGNTKYDSRENCNAIIETTSNTLIAGCKNTVIPNSVTSIGDYAFNSCSGLTSITIPNSVTSIGRSAFSYCRGLTSLKIPNSVTKISSAFYGCPGLKSISVENGNTKYDSRENCNAIIETASNTLIAGCKNTVIPNSVTAIGDQAFLDCPGLTSVTIPNSVTSIGTQAFYQCTGLTSVTIPNNVTSIGWYAFCYCSSLTSIKIPNSVTSIGALAFSQCSGLTDVYCYAENVPITDKYAFSSQYIANSTLYVIEGSIELYKATEPWNEFGTIMAFDPDKKCATPTVVFENGKMSILCDTEGVKLHYKYSFPDGAEGDGSEADIPKKITISVYATKDGYEDSDVATEEINLRGDANLDGEIGMPDVMFIVNYILNGKFPDEK